MWVRNPPIPLNSVLEAQMTNGLFRNGRMAHVCFKEGFNGDDPAVSYLRKL
jgi:hypothetical protein